MALHETKKNVKIIDEMLFYFVEKGFNDVTIDCHFNKIETVLEFTVCDKDRLLDECIKNDIYVERDAEVEEYGYELMGESDTASELQLVGMLIDSIDIKRNNDVIKVVLKRIK